MSQYTDLIATYARMGANELAQVTARMEQQLGILSASVSELQSQIAAAKKARKNREAHGSVHAAETR